MSGSVRRSLVWEYYKIIDQTKVVCMLCVEQLNKTEEEAVHGRKDASTSALRKHLKALHMDHVKPEHRGKLEEVTPRKRKAISPIQGGDPSSPNSKRSRMDLDSTEGFEKLLHACIAGDISVHSVYCKEFRDFLEWTRCNLALPTKKEFFTLYATKVYETLSEDEKREKEMMMLQSSGQHEHQIILHQASQASPQHRQDAQQQQQQQQIVAKDIVAEKPSHNIILHSPNVALTQQPQHQQKHMVAPPPHHNQQQHQQQQAAGGGENDADAQLLSPHHAIHGVEVGVGVDGLGVPVSPKRD